MRIITRYFAITIDRHMQYLRIGSKIYGFEIKYSRLVKFARLNKGASVYQFIK